MTEVVATKSGLRSFGFRDSASGAVHQVDVREVQARGEMLHVRDCGSYGIFSAMVDVALTRLSREELRYTVNDGLCVLVKEGMQARKSLVLSKDSLRIFDFLRLDHGRFEQGFYDDVDLIAYLTASPLIPLSAFAAAKTKTRLAQALESYFRENPSLLVDQQQSLAVNFVDVRLAVNFVDDAVRFFGMKEEVDRVRAELVRDLREREAQSQKWNGHIAQEITGLNYKDLGAFMKRFNAEYVATGRIHDMTRRDIEQACQATLDDERRPTRAARAVVDDAVPDATCVREDGGGVFVFTGVRVSRLTGLTGVRLRRFMLAMRERLDAGETMTTCDRFRAALPAAKPFVAAKKGLTALMRHDTAALMSSFPSGFLSKVFVEARMLSLNLQAPTDADYAALQRSGRTVTIVANDQVYVKASRGISSITSDMITGARFAPAERAVELLENTTTAELLRFLRDDSSVETMSLPSGWINRAQIEGAIGSVSNETLSAFVTPDRKGKVRGKRSDIVARSDFRTEEERELVGEYYKAIQGHSCHVAPDVVKFIDLDNVADYGEIYHVTDRSVWDQQIQFSGLCRMGRQYVHMAYNPAYGRAEHDGTVRVVVDVRRCIKDNPGDPRLTFFEVENSVIHAAGTIPAEYLEVLRGAVDDVNPRGHAASEPPGQ